MTDGQIPSIILGQAELVDIIDYSIDKVPARVDTGARTSSFWATDIALNGSNLEFVLFGPSSEFYTGQKLVTSEFTETVVASSIGFPQKRFKVKMRIRIGGKRILAKFTLADRSTQVYPVLIGRNTLRGKFIVNVKAGTVLLNHERAKTAELRKQLENNKDKK